MNGSRLAIRDAAPEPSSGIGPAFMITMDDWPHQSYLELGALPSAVPSARLHARFVVAEWGHGALSDTVELIVSELVTNGVKASQKLPDLSSVWLGLAGNADQVFIAVWDANEEPIQASVTSDDELPDLDAEGGRGLLLVESLSTDWGVYWLEEGRGKVVWSVVTADISATEPASEGSQAHIPLPRRVPHRNAFIRPVHVMNDLALLKRVREGLTGFE